MTCEWAEGYLSAYLDDALDPQLRKDVGAHIESCARCQALAEEYRRNDQLLATLTPLTPPDDLRQRIFESPAFAELGRELERETADAPPGRRASRRVPLYLRALVPAAALLTVSLGAALLFRQGLLPFGAQTASQHQTTTIGGPSSFDLPLSAGPRLVYLNGGTLWSVAEYATGSSSAAPGSPQQLTAAGARIAAWRVSPLAGGKGGARIAYVDARTGALHIVHSDGQDDTIVASITPTQSPSATFWASAAGRAALAGLAWSPDGSRLAYVAATSDGGSQAYVYTLGSSREGALVATTHGSPISQLSWSADSRALAFTTTTSGGAQRLAVWRGSGHSLTTLPASATDAHATVAQIGWNGSTLTWSVTSAAHGGSIVGVYRLAPGASAATRLSAAGVTYDVAAFTPAHGGVWLLAGEGALSEARLSGGMTRVAALPAAASDITWSPNGATAALMLGDRLALWSATNGLTTLASGVSAQPTPAWSPDSSALAVAQGQRVSVYHISDGSATQVAQLSGDAAPLALVWAADGRNIAIAESHGTLLVASDGESQALLTSHLAQNAALSWSVAG